MKAPESSSYLSIATFDGVALTQQERDALADRIEKVILERRRQAVQRRRLARWRQMQSLERTRDRQQEAPVVAA